VIKVTIAGMSVEAGKASEGWVNQMLAEARKTGAALCVRIEVQQPPIQMVLATPGCGGGGAGGRQPNEQERRIFDAWNKRGLGSGSFSPGELRSFLNDLARIM
jgi:hypothetical protein